MKSVSVLFLSAIFLFSTESSAADSQSAKGDISSYLVDIGASPVSAGGLVGLSGSAITNIQSAQDLVVAINPFTTGSSKSGYGLAITPARTKITPMSGQSYYNSNLWRLLGATTISYAENASTISGASYRKSAVSLDATYYLNRDDDPILLNYYKFTDCLEKKKHTEAASEAAFKGDMATRDKEMALANKAYEICSGTPESKWNADKLSISYGAGWIEPDVTPNSRLSLGRTLAVGGVLEIGNDSAAYISLRRTTSEVDLRSLAGTPTYNSSTLTAIRLTQGSTDGGDLRWLIEFSNAKTSSVTVSNSVFKSAVGLDKKLSSNAWLEFRFGRKRTEDGTAMQNASLLNLNWAPSSTLFGSKQNN